MFICHLLPVALLSSCSSAQEHYPQPSSSSSFAVAPAVVRGNRMRDMSGSSSSSWFNAKILPIINCPRCCIPIIRLVSKREETYNEVFYKCENNIRNDPTSCGFFKSEEQYERYLEGQNRLPHQRQDYARPVKNDQGMNVVVQNVSHQLLELKHELVSGSVLHRRLVAAFRFSSPSLFPALEMMDRQG